MSANGNYNPASEYSETSPVYPVFHTREEYVKALDSWVNQAKLWQNVSLCFPYILMANQMSQSISTSQSRQEHSISNEARHQHTEPRHIPTDLNDNEGFEFVVPPVWKRIVAEGVDFLILFVLKLVLTLLALEVMDSTNWQFLKKDLISNITDISLRTELTGGILILEGVHRIIVCAYEVYWLRGTRELRFGCATPGKALLGITVIAATKIRTVDNRARQTVLVYPAKDLGFLIALCRSFIKNLLIAVMFPFFIAFFLFQFNRIGYDIVCNTLVVEYDPNPPKRNWQ